MCVCVRDFVVPIMSSRLVVRKRRHIGSMHRSIRMSSSSKGRRSTTKTYAWLRFRRRQKKQRRTKLEEEEEANCGDTERSDSSSSSLPPLRDASVLRRQLGSASASNLNAAVAPDAAAAARQDNLHISSADSPNNLYVRRSMPSMTGESSIPANTSNFASHSHLYAPKRSSFSALSLDGYSVNTFIRATRQHHLTSEMLMRTRNDRKFEDRRWSTAGVGNLSVGDKTSQVAWSFVTIVVTCAVAVAFSAIKSVLASARRKREWRWRTR